jgi:hypothetical protein
MGFCLPKLFFPGGPVVAAPHNDNDMVWFIVRLDARSLLNEFLELSSI